MSKARLACGVALSALLLTAAQAADLDAAATRAATGVQPWTLGSSTQAAHGASPLASVWLRHADRVQQFRLGQARIDLSLAEFDGLRQRAHLFGDYYLTGPGFGAGQVDGGLRLTSGLAIGRVDTGRLTGHPAAAGHQELPRVGLDSRAVAQPYLGLGYSGLSTRAGWAFSADIGLGRWATSDSPRLGQGTPSDGQVERLLDDLRLSPVIQLGVRYAF